jgi:hypothetical protein
MRQRGDCRGLRVTRSRLTLAGLLPARSLQRFEWGYGPQPGCQHNATAPLARQCWRGFRAINMSSPSTSLDSYQRPYPNGYAIRLLNVSVVCQRYVSLDCVAQLGPVGCIQAAQAAPAPAAPSAPAVPQRAALPAPPGLVPGGEQGVTQGPRRPSLGLILGCTLGGAAWRCRIDGTNRHRPASHDCIVGPRSPHARLMRCACVCAGLGLLAVLLGLLALAKRRRTPEAASEPRLPRKCQAQSPSPDEFDKAAPYDSLGTPEWVSLCGPDRQML